LEDEKDIKTAEKVCSENSLIHVPDPNFCWLQILHENRNKKNHSGVFKLHVSTLTAAFIQNNLDVLDTDTFHKLTDMKVLSKVHFKAALLLIDAVRQIVVAPDGKQDQKLTSLQKRCVATLSKDWD